MGRGVFDLDHPWFRPLWRRLLVTGIALGWGVLELASGSPGFAVLFLALGAYAGWRLFVTFNPRGDE
ncbi:DUF3329 domain-containing protein [Albidovulum sp.]|jgi:hypothetical protein|uniref:DUF3329 domain-containing protein n=1 Tax=Albidovulum sp. TaxID=1872424 RepID=UPI00302EB0CD